MGLTLLAQSSFSSQYCVDTFLTLVFLINRLPTKVLSNKTPHFLLHKTDPTYMNLRVFGCACYPLLRLYTHNKLAFRSKKCLFLGYSNCKKGYRCLDLATKRVYISRHVIFDENSFPVKAIAVPTTSRSTNPAAGTPLIITSSVLSSDLLSNIFVVVPSHTDSSPPSIPIPILAASDIVQHSPSPAQNNYPSPTRF